MWALRELATQRHSAGMCWPASGVTSAMEKSVRMSCTIKEDPWPWLAMATNNVGVRLGFMGFMGFMGLVLVEEALCMNTACAGALLYVYWSGMPARIVRTSYTLHKLSEW